MSAPPRLVRLPRLAPGAILLLLAATPRSRAAEAELPAEAPSEIRYRLPSPFADPAFRVPESEPRKNTLVALGEVAAVNVLMWQFSYWAGKDYAKISGTSIANNFHKGWIVDTDPFWVNQLGHPYEGSLFFTAARSTGHGPYESLGIAFLGSLMWEQLMETQSPSVNDQISTAFGGSVLGEVLYRLYRLALDSGGARPSGWRRFGAFALSPVSGTNELLFGDRYRGAALLPPSWMGELQVGMVLGGRAEDDTAGAEVKEPGPWASLAAHVEYGIPGTPDLSLRAPFDHFDLRAAVAFTNRAEPDMTLLIRGLVIGDTVTSGKRPIGLWGLFASYDVLGVSVFKATGFGLGPGASLVGRWRRLELHGTALAELLPWAGGGSIEKLYARDYHYGVGAAGVLDLRALIGDRFIVDLAARGYLVSGSYATGSSEDIGWAHAAIVARLAGPHGISVSGDWASRHARYPAHADISQRGAVLLAHYTLLQGW